MTDTPTHNSLLEEIYMLGEQLEFALKADNIDRFTDLVEQRGVLVERLQALDPPAPGDERLKAHADSLQRQHGAILAAATMRESRLVATQGALKQVQHATIRYKGSREVPRFLNKNLSG